MKKVLALIILFFSIMTLSSISCNADTGPKPSTKIEIFNMNRSDYIVGYATKYKDYYGPHKAFDPNDDIFYYGKKDDLLVLYNNVMLPQGWYLFDISSSFTDVNSIILDSGYYWPSEFILIIYDYKNDVTYLSNDTSTYALNSYFIGDFKNLNNNSFILKKNYNYSLEIIKLIVRILLTIAIEMLLALAFRFTKRSYLIILCTNVVTQILLNVGLNLFSFKNGVQLMFIIFYIFMEIFVIIIEAMIYKNKCKRGKNKDNSFIVGYTVLANLLSFFIGTILWFFKW